MSRNRKIAKRFDLNEKEAAMLRKRAKDAAMCEADLIRAMIMYYAPRMAPGKEFYDIANDINKVGVNINQIAAVANATGVIGPDSISYLLEAAKYIKEQVLEMKELVVKPERFFLTFDEAFNGACEEAKRLGEPEPDIEDDITRYIDGCY